MTSNPLLIKNINKSTDGGVCINSLPAYYDGNSIPDGNSISEYTDRCTKYIIYDGKMNRLVECQESIGLLVRRYYEKNGIMAFILEDGTLCGCSKDYILRMISTNVVGAIVIGVDIVYVNFDKDNRVCLNRTNLIIEKGKFMGFGISTIRLEELTSIASGSHLSNSTECKTEMSKNMHTVQISVKVISGMMFLYVGDPCPFNVFFIDDRVCAGGWVAVPKSCEKFTDGNISYPDPAMNDSSDKLLVRIDRNTCNMYKIVKAAYSYYPVGQTVEAIIYIHDVEYCATIDTSSYVMCDITNISYALPELIFEIPKVPNYEYNTDVSNISPREIISFIIPTSSLKTNINQSSLVSSMASLICFKSKYFSRKETNDFSKLHIPIGRRKLNIFNFDQLKYKYYNTPYGIVRVNYINGHYAIKIYFSYTNFMSKISINGSFQELLVTWRYLVMYSELDGDIMYYDLSEIFNKSNEYLKSKDSCNRSKTARRYDNIPESLVTDFNINPVVFTNGIYDDPNISISSSARSQYVNVTRIKKFIIHYEYDNNMPSELVEFLIRQSIEVPIIRFEVIPLPSNITSEEQQEIIASHTFSKSPPMECTHAKKILYHHLFAWIAIKFYTENEYGQLVWRQDADTDAYLKKIFPKNHRKYPYAFVHFFAKLIAGYFLDFDRELPVPLPLGFVIALSGDFSVENLKTIIFTDLITNAEKSPDPKKYIRNALDVTKSSTIEFVNTLQNLIRYPFKVSLDATQIFLHGCTFLSKERSKASLALYTTFKYDIGQRNEALEMAWPAFVMSLSDNLFRTLMHYWDTYPNCAIGTEYTLCVANTTVYELDDDNVDIDINNRSQVQEYIRTVRRPFENEGYSRIFGEPLIKTRARPYVSPDGKLTLPRPPFVNGRHKKFFISPEVAEDLEILRTVLQCLSDR
jgi:hypothetical protein